MGWYHSLVCNHVHSHQVGILEAQPRGVVVLVSHICVRRFLIGMWRRCAFY